MERKASRIRTAGTASLFQRVEKQPLSNEQARAVVCFDNRVQVIAAAGSGKTSTMVAKAGYALRRQIVAPEKILLLAFNADAAAELKARIRDRLLPLGLPADRVAAQTFHAFGLEVIGRATGIKPALAPWLDRDQDFDQVMRIVDELRDSSAAIRSSWDLFRVVLNRDLPEFGEEENDPEDWDAATKATGFRTLRGELVRSQGERLIADWLYFNGVSYEYERSYEHQVADETHSQYRPDFYYPDVGVYHEHFALDANGRPPAEFEGYAEGVLWKRATHAQYGTSLIETTMAQIWDGSAFAQLAAMLESRGIVLDPNPDRPVAGYRAIDNDQLVRTFRSFLIHAKSNRLDDAALQSRLTNSPSDRFRFRHSIFLALFAAIRFEWERKLVDADQIDFEDMANHAADHLENQTWTSPYELVMVDELQDASPARARLVRALVNAPGRYLFGVGDDWQSINRFAGADLSVMTDFHKWFGAGETLRLERTFRAPQSICDVSSRFVQKNPTQLQKRVTSGTPEFPPSISAFAARSDDELAAAVVKHLARLDEDVRTGSVEAGRGGKVSVFVLGRYNQDLKYLRPRRWSHLTIAFHTIHGSKGLEADYIVMPRVVKGSYGFPSKRMDDPVLLLAMPAREEFPFAEERRLFYVALTRARRAVALFTIEDRVSPFLVELAQEHGIQLERLSGVAHPVIPCSACKRGTMVLRRSKFGAFHGCSEYPNCRNTARV
jgi:DNA helicase-4